MTDSEYHAIIKRVMDLCDQKMIGYKGVSLRSALRELNVPSDDLEEVILLVAEGGFTYCLDHRILCSEGGGGKKMIYPSASVCYWGPDQLKSRLSCISNVPYNIRWA